MDVKDRARDSGVVVAWQTTGETEQATLDATVPERNWR